MAGPALAGADQLTVRLVADAGDTDGAPGAAGGSSVSVTVMVKVVLSFNPCGSVAVTVTSYERFAS